MPATSTLYPTTVASTTGSTWTTTSNATGSGTGTTSAAWAVFTNAASGGTGTINLSGYAAQAAGPASGDTIDSVVLSLRGNVASTARWTAASCTAQLFAGTTAIGSPVAIGTLSTSTSNVWTITFSGGNAPTYAQLADLRVRITAVHSGTTSSTFNVDTAGLVVNYTVATTPPPSEVIGYASVAGATTTLTVTKAAVESRLGGTVTDGDLLVGIVSWDWGASSSVVASTGTWETKLTQLGSGTIDGANVGARVRVFLRTAASEPASWSFAQPSSSDGTLTVIVLRGLSTVVANIIAASQSAGTTTSTTQTTPTVDHAGIANSILLLGAAIDAGGANTWTPPVTTVELADIQSNTFTSQGVAVLKGPADPTGTFNFANTFSGTQNSAGVQWALVIPPGSTPSQGSSTGAWSFAGSATGARAPKATGAGSWSFAGAAVGKRTPKATTSGAWSFAGAAAGKRTPKATASGAWSFAGAAAGVAPPSRGSGTGSWSFAGAAAGTKVPKAAGTGAWAFSGSAVGQSQRRGTASGSWSFSGTAAGDAPSNSGSANGAWSFAGFASGAKTPKATGTGAWSFTGSAVGSKPQRGSASGSWSFAGSATGKRVAKATGSGAWGFAGSATGKTFPKGAGAGTVSWNGLATSGSGRAGFGSGAFSFTGSASGNTSKRGSASGAWGFAGSASGQTARRGTSTGVWAFVGTSAGTTGRSGSGSGSWLYVGSAVGDAPKRGTGAGIFSFVGSATGSSAPLVHGVPIRAGLPLPDSSVSAGYPIIDPGVRAGPPLPNAGVRAGLPE